MDLKSENAVQARTSGDGMEQEEIGKVLDEVTIDQIEEKPTKSSFDTEIISTKSRTSSVYSLPIPGLHTLYRRSTTEYQSTSLPPYIPKGKLIILTPKFIKSSVLPEHKKDRPPKFIPFEPYPGAVNPIIPLKSKCKRMKKNRNNLDLNVLVNQMSSIKTHELNSGTLDTLTQVKIEEKSIDKTEVDELNNEIKKLNEEKNYFQSQMKFQIQVNAELKNLLVASVGEDLQTRVNILTEDKLQLARALLDTANNLSTHTEQIEFLAGQCEVWRSKFLASSVMIEELARWKADLTQKNSLLSESNKQMLTLTGKLRDMQIEMLKNLKFLSNLKILNLPSSDIINLTSECLNITQQMVLHSGVGIPEDLVISNLNTLSDNEKSAYQALESVSQPLMATDEAYRAIVGQAQRPYGGTENNKGTIEINKPSA